MTNWGSVGKDTAYGAGTGAVVGSVVPGIGTTAGAVGGGIIAGVGSWLSQQGGKGGGNMKAYKVDPTGGSGFFQYGGEDYDWENGGISGAEKRARRYDQLGAAYAERPDAFADYTTADQDYARQQEARGQQLALGQQYQDVIAGKTPSLAEMQMRQGQDATAQQALNMAASARGGGGMLAQQQAINANALGQQRVGQDAAMLRAQETAQARDAYGNLVRDMRGADLGSMGQRADMAQAQAGIQLTSEQQRFAQGMGYQQGADGLRQDQRDTNLSVQQGNQSAATAVQTGAAQAAAADRASTRGMIAGLGSSALTAGSVAYTGGGKK